MNFPLELLDMKFLLIIIEILQKTYFYITYTGKHCGTGEKADSSSQILALSFPSHMALGKAASHFFLSCRIYMYEMRIIIPYRAVAS